MVSVRLDRFLRSETDRCVCVLVWLILFGSLPGEEEEIEVEQEEEQKGPDLKLASRRDMYSICQSVGLGRSASAHRFLSLPLYLSIHLSICLSLSKCWHPCRDFVLHGFLLTVDGLAKKFGLTPEQFGENLRDSYQRHETEQFPAEPVELAKDYVCSQFSTPEAVLEGTRYMVAMQIAREPLVRHVLRQTFQERAKINIKPTKKGKKVRKARIRNLPALRTIPQTQPVFMASRPLQEVDEAHFAYSFKYLKNKPVKELNGEQFLKMCLAEDEGLLTIDVCIDLIGVKG